MRRFGFTLIEILVCLAVLAMLLAVAAPPAFRWRDAAAVRAARDELAAGLGWARMAAAAHGGAALLLDPLTGRYVVGTGKRLDPPVDLAGRYGVAIDPGTRAPVTFRYDALGIGRITSRTVRFRRGAAEAGLTVSAYGRYRRW